MKHTLFLLLLLFVFDYASARRLPSVTVQWPNDMSRGSTEIIVSDKQTKEPLIGATVTVVAGSDTLRGTTIKRDYGFSVQAGYAVEGKFKDSIDLEIRYVGYQPFRKRYAPRQFRNYLSAEMEVDPQAIAQVVVLGKQVAMVFRGDTTVYNAGAFKTFADDRMGELLKQLPGIEIKDNKIFSNGKEVRRVLIDGRNLFGTATQHALTDLEASDVKSIQIYEDLSSHNKRLDDQTAEKEKVMNIETKSKRRVLRGGEVAATLGTSLEQDYSGRHEIRHQESATLYSNSERNSLRFNASNSKDSGSKEFSTRITPTKESAANMMHMLLRGDSTMIMTSIYFNRSRNDNLSSTQSDYFPTADYALRTDQNTNRSLAKQHSTDINHTTYLERGKSTFTADIGLSMQNSDSDQASRSTQQIDQEITRTQLGSNSETRSYQIRASIDYAIKLSKHSALTFTAQANYGKNQSDGWQIDTVASTPGLRIKLNSNGSGDNYNLSVGVQHRYKLGKYGAWRNTYTFSRTNNHTRQLAVDFLHHPEGEIDRINSYKYTNNLTNHSLYSSLEYHKEELRCYAKIEVASNRISRREFYPNEELFPRNFLLFNPSISLSHDTNKRKISLSIYSNSLIPSIESLRNTIDATNPLTLQAGNPDLKLARNLSGNFSLQFTNPEQAQTLNLSLSSGYTFNYVTSRRTLFLEETYLEAYDYTAQKGAQLTTQVNVGGSYHVNGALFYNKQFAAISSTFNASLNYSFQQTPYYLAEALLKSRNHALSCGLTLSSGFSRKIKLSLGSSTSLTRTIAQQTTANELRQSVFGRTNLRFGKYFGMLLCNYQFYRNSRSKSLTRQNTLFNAYAGRKFGKNNRLGCSIGVVDLFNRSRYTTTTINTDYITDSTSAYLGRYVYANVTYTF